MLKLVKSFDELDLRQLVELHAQTIAQDGVRNYSEQPANLQIIFAEQDYFSFLRHFFNEPDATYAVWVVDNVYTAALRLERYDDGILISGLETAVWARRKGYAFALMQSMIAAFTAEKSVKLYSHVAYKNTASMMLHRKCGFQRCLDYAVYLDGSVVTDACTLCLEITNAT